MLRGTAPKSAPRSPSSPHRLHPVPQGAEAIQALPQGTEVIHVEHKNYDLPASVAAAAASAAVSAVAASAAASVAAAAPHSMDDDEGPHDLSMPQDLTTERRLPAPPARDAVAMETEQTLVPPLMQIKVEQDEPVS